MHLSIRRTFHSGRFVKILQLLVASIAVGGVLAGCSLFRAGGAPTPTQEVSITRNLRPTKGAGGNWVTPSLQSTLASQPPSSAASLSPTPIPSAPLSTVAESREAASLTLEIPEPGETVYSPVYVRGSAAVPSERALEIQVLTLDGEILGRGPILFDAVTPVGEEAVYEGTLSFRQPKRPTLGSIRVLMRDARNDSVIYRMQVPVTLLPAGRGATDITIDTPTAGTVIGNPVHVAGAALAPQNQVTVRLKSGPAVFAAETVSLSGNIGQPGRFSVDLDYTPLAALAADRPGYPAPSESVAGYIEVFFRSPKDGRMTEIAAVPVVIPIER